MWSLSRFATSAYRGKAKPIEASTKQGVTYITYTMDKEAAFLGVEEDDEAVDL